MRTIRMAGQDVPVLGLGTWHMGDSPQRRGDEICALRTGIEHGMTLIDTAELYGSGRSERLVGTAIRGIRDQVFLVSKVMPSNAGHADTVRACEQSLERLGTDHLDLYLLHWRGGIPLSETVAAFHRLQDAGKIRAWGVSNFDRDDLAELDQLGETPATDQVLVNLRQRWSESGLLADLHQRAIPVMAYSPVEQGVLTQGAALDRVAQRHGTTPTQIALAWVVSHPQVMAIPQTSSVQHVVENAAAAEIVLDAADLTELDESFPPPTGPEPMRLH